MASGACGRDCWPHGEREMMESDIGGRLGYELVQRTCSNDLLSTARKVSL